MCQGGHSATSGGLQNDWPLILNGEAAYRIPGQCSSQRQSLESKEDRAEEQSPTGDAQMTQTLNAVQDSVQAPAPQEGE